MSLNIIHANGFKFDVTLQPGIVVIEAPEYNNREVRIGALSKVNVRSDGNL